MIYNALYDRVYAIHFQHFPQSVICPSPLSQGSPLHSTSTIHSKLSSKVQLSLTTCQYFTVSFSSPLRREIILFCPFILGLPQYTLHILTHTEQWQDFIFAYIPISTVCRHHSFSMKLPVLEHTICFQMLVFLIVISWKNLMKFCMEILVCCVLKTSQFYFLIGSLQSNIIDFINKNSLSSPVI